GCWPRRISRVFRAAWATIRPTRPIPPSSTSTSAARRRAGKASVRFTLIVCLALLCVPREAGAYSVLAHEANIDALWETSLRPLLARRYPRATRDELTQARAYAYGGAVIQDLGYYPFGSHFFSNLVHYVRTGDFVEAMLRE